MNIDVHQCKNCIITLDTRILDTTNSPLPHPATAAGWWINFAVSTPAAAAAPRWPPRRPQLSSCYQAKLNLWTRLIRSLPIPLPHTSYCCCYHRTGSLHPTPLAFTINSYAEIGILSHEVADEVDGLSFLWASQYFPCWSGDPSYCCAGVRETMRPMAGEALVTAPPYLHIHHPSCRGETDNLIPLPHGFYCNWLIRVLEGFTSTSCTQGLG